MNLTQMCRELQGKQGDIKALQGQVLIWSSKQIFVSDITARFEAAVFQESLDAIRATAHLVFPTSRLLFVYSFYMDDVYN